MQAPRSSREALRLPCWICFVILWMPGASPRLAEAATFTPISVNATVSASIIGSLANYDETLSSTDLEPSLALQNSVASGNIFVHSSVSASNRPGTSPPSVSVSTGFSAKTSGSTNDTAISYSYALTFSLDQTSLVSLVNGNSGGAFPRASATDPPGSASLTYLLRRQAGPTIFAYAAPPTNSAGTYEQAIVAAGTYEFIITGSASAAGDACCVQQSATASGIVQLEFEDAVLPVPLLGPGGLAVLAIALGIGSALAVVRWRRRRV